MERKMGYPRDPLRKQQESYIKDIYLIISRPFQRRPDPLADQTGKTKMHGITDLVILSGPISHEDVVIRKGQDPGGVMEGENQRLELSSALITNKTTLGLEFAPKYV
jgi:hypothetical protein